MSSEKLASAYFQLDSAGAFTGLDLFYNSVKQQFGNEFSYKQVSEFYNGLIDNQTHKLNKRPKLFRHFLFNGLNVRRSQRVQLEINNLFRPTLASTGPSLGLAAVEEQTLLVSTFARICKRRNYIFQRQDLLLEQTQLKLYWDAFARWAQQPAHI